MDAENGGLSLCYLSDCRKAPRSCASIYAEIAAAPRSPLPIYPVGLFFFRGRVSFPPLTSVPLSGAAWWKPDACFSDPFFTRWEASPSVTAAFELFRVSRLDPPPTIAASCRIERLAPVYRDLGRFIFLCYRLLTCRFSGAPPPSVFVFPSPFAFDKVEISKRVALSGSLVTLCR